MRHPRSPDAWNLRIESHRKDLGVVFVFWSVSKGPPYAVNFTPYGEALGRSVKITKLEVTMPDGTVHDVLNGQPVELPVKSYGPRQARYKSEELPLKFKEGAEMSIELHCQTSAINASGPPQGVSPLHFGVNKCVLG